MKLANQLMIAITFVFFVAQMALWYTGLPEIMPSHFDAAGQVDGEMSKTAFYALFVVMNLLSLVGFLLFAIGLGRVPNSMLNIPHKEYWLAPERREQTISFNRSLLMAIGWMTSWLFIGIFHLSANVAIASRENINPEFYWLLGAYLLAIAGVTIWALLKFRLPVAAKQTSAGSA